MGDNLCAGTAWTNLKIESAQMSSQPDGARERRWVSPIKQTGDGFATPDSFRDLLRQIADVVEYDQELLDALCDECREDGISPEVNMMDTIFFDVARSGRDSEGLHFSWQDIEMFAAVKFDAKVDDRGVARLPNQSFYNLDYDHYLLDRSLGERDMRDLRTRRTCTSSSGVEHTVELLAGLTPYAAVPLRDLASSDDYDVSYSDYSLVARVDHDARQSPTSIDAIVQGFLFEASSQSGLALVVSELPWGDDGSDVIHKNPIDFAFFEDKASHPVLRCETDLESVLRLWVESSRLDIPNFLAVIGFVRVLEYVSATYTKKETHDQVRRVIRASSRGVAQSADVEEILMYAKGYQSLKDGESIRRTICDICSSSALADEMAGPLGHLREGLLSQNVKEKNAALTGFCKIILATRNSYVHAKPNYTPTGDEIPEQEAEFLIRPLARAAELAIRWLKEQPEHVRVGDKQ